MGLEREVDVLASVCGCLMDLIQINRSDYSPGKLVELDWSTDSLIWSERFQQLGDFELHTQNVDGVKALLPERSMCSLRDSDEVMWVDSHNIETDDEGVDMLTVKGRSLEWILMRRVWKNAPYGKKIKMAKKYSVRQAVEVWVWNAICNDTGNDRIKTSADYPAANHLPNVVVTDSVPPSSDGPNLARKVNNGDVYSQMQTFLSSGKLGIRIIRPKGAKGRVVHIDGDGTFNTDSVSDISDLRFDFYKGRDISDRIVFSWKAGHLDNPTYFFSSENLMTGAFVDGDPREHYYTDPDVVAGTNAGWNRLDGYVDGGSNEDLERHAGESDADFADRKDADNDDFEESLEDIGLRTVRHDGAHIVAVDGAISPNINLKYGKDYKLGDRVLMQGRYGAHEKKYVTEFIRSKDKEGEVGAPTLSTTLS
jgi:ReqiPepy6 Gp37-like protein